MSIEQTLAERGQRYGNFLEHATITQGIKAEMAKYPGWLALAADQKQALEVIADKIGRMLNGDPNYTDNWHDIAGYAKLVEDRLLGGQARVETMGMVQTKVPVNYEGVMGIPPGCGSHPVQAPFGGHK